MNATATTQRRQGQQITSRLPVIHHWTSRRSDCIRWLKNSLIISNSNIYWSSPLWADVVLPLTWTLKKTCDNVVKLHSIQTTLVHFVYSPCSWPVSGLTTNRFFSSYHSSAMFILSMTWCELVCNQVEKFAMSQLGKTFGPLFFFFKHLVCNWNLKMFDYCFCWTDVSSIVLPAYTASVLVHNCSNDCIETKIKEFTGGIRKKTNKKQQNPRQTITLRSK